MVARRWLRLDELLFLENVECVPAVVSLSLLPPPPHPLRELPAWEMLKTLGPLLLRDVLSSQLLFPFASNSECAWSSGKGWLSPSSVMTPLFFIV